MLLATGRAALEVRPYAGDRDVGLASRELQLDVAIELLEAPLACQLLAGRAQQTGQQVGGSRKAVFAHPVLPSIGNPP